MRPLLAQLLDGLHLIGEVPADVVAFLTLHRCPNTLDHSQRVAAEARRLAGRFGVDEGLAEAAGWLHDVSAVCPVGRRVEAARELGIEVLPEEEAAPLVLHQKLSAAIAREVFGVTSGTVLSAVACHTTLKAHASALDKVIFIADKAQWDQAHQAPYLEAVLAGLERSLDAGVLAHLEHVWERRTALAVVHPWLAEAYAEMSGK